jgi:hypothetical protein
VLQGPATALQGFRTGFTQYLAQRYTFKGVANCSPVATEANAQAFLTQRGTALRNAKQNVVETGWTETAEAATPAPSAVANPTPASARTAPAATAPAAAGARSGATAAPTNGSAAAGATQSQGRASTAAGNNNNNNNNGSSKNDTATEVASVIGALFGTNNSGAARGNTSGSNTSGSNTSGSNTASKTTPPASGRGANAKGGGSDNQNTASQVSSTLTSVFSNKSTAAPNGAARGTQPAGASNAQAGLPNGALGAATSGTTRLVVYGCGRQDMQVACVTELTNENAKDSLVQSANVWKDAFLVDDRGDRHLRTNGFFLNIDGEQRQQIDISVGKTAKFILMFDNVQTRVQKVALRSQIGGLDVEEIGLISADTQGAAANGAPAAPQR